jgi:hypothetical protein
LGTYFTAASDHPAAEAARHISDSLLPMTGIAVSLYVLLAAILIIMGVALRVISARSAEEGVKT